MSNDLVRADNKSVSNTAGNALVVAGAAGGGLVLLAGILPFISLPFLLIAMVISGLVLKVKA
jgi:hypothetical protein